MVVSPFARTRGWVNSFRHHLQPQPSSLWSGIACALPGSSSGRAPASTDLHHCRRLCQHLPFHLCTSTRTQPRARASVCHFAPPQEGCVCAHAGNALLYAPTPSPPAPQLTVCTTPLLRPVPQCVGSHSSLHNLPCAPAGGLRDAPGACAHHCPECSFVWCSRPRCTSRSRGRTRT